MIVNEKSQLMELWRTSFDDSEDFIRLFFNRVYQKENALFFAEDGKIVSALHMLPYTMNFYGMEIPISYIYGAGTLPAERGRGLMRRLVQEAFEVMQKRGITLTVIIPAEPWLFDFYRNLGYIEAFDYAVEKYIRTSETTGEQDIRIVPAETLPMDCLYSYFNRKQRERNCYVLHNYDDFITILRDLQLSGGQLLTAVNTQDEPTGMLFAYLDADTVRVKDLMYDNDIIKQQLLQEATTQSKVEKAICHTPTIGQKSAPLGMARVFDRDRLIRHWISTHPNAQPDIKELEIMDIRSLTQLLLSYRNREGYISLMLD